MFAVNITMFFVGFSGLYIGWKTRGLVDRWRKK